MTISQIENELLRISARQMLLESAQDRIDGELEKLLTRKQQLLNLMALVSAARGLRLTPFVREGAQT